MCMKIVGRLDGWLLGREKENMGNKELHTKTTETHTTDTNIKNILYMKSFIRSYHDKLLNFRILYSLYV